MISGLAIYKLSREKWRIEEYMKILKICKMSCPAISLLDERMEKKYIYDISSSDIPSYFPWYPKDVEENELISILQMILIHRKKNEGN